MSDNTRAAPDYLIPIQDLIHSTSDEKRLFDAASGGEIELLFEVYDYLGLLLVPNGGMNSPVGEPNPMRRPTHLVLETALCKRFKVKSSLPVQKASRGYLRGDEGIILRCLDASDADNEAMPVCVNGIESPRPHGDRPARWAFWGFHMDGKRQDYVVTKDHLFVRATERWRWAGREMDKEPSEIYVPRKGRATDYISEQLKRMCEAAEKFWGDKTVIRSERSTHPPPQVIVDWLVDVGFSPAKAENAEKFIAPEWAQRPGRPSK